MARLVARADSGRRFHSRSTPCYLTSRTVREKYGEETADKRGSQRWWWKGDRRRDGKAARREDSRQVDRKKTTEEADRGDGSQRSERWSKGYKPRHGEAMKRADQRRAKRPRSETTEADPKKPTGDANRDYKAALLEIIRQIGVGEVRKQLGEVEMGYNPAKEKRQDDASRELSRSKEKRQEEANAIEGREENDRSKDERPPTEKRCRSTFAKRQEEANAIEGREENDPPEQELTETETASEVLEPSEASNTKELANIEAATRARQDARLSVPVQQDNGNGRIGIGMPLYLVGTRKELRENAEKRESDLKNKENDEKQEEKRNKHDAEVRARAMEKHVTTSPPKSAASEQGCRCNAVDDSETPAGFCLNIRKPAPTAPVTAEKATKEETAATTKMEERSALEPDSPEAKNEAGNVSIAMPPPQPPLQRADALLDSSQGTLVPKDSDDEPSAWIRRALRRNGRQKRQAKEKPHVHRESSVEDSSQRNIAMRIFNGVVTKSS